MYNLKKFQSEEQYNQYALGDEFIAPNLSIISDSNKKVKYQTDAPIRVTGVTINNSLELVVGNSETLIPTVLPTNAYDKTVSWSSSDNTVATVNENGLVTAIASGNAVITVTTTDGSFTAQCQTSVSGHDYSKEYFTIDPDGELTIETYNQKFYYSTDDGATWQQAREIEDSHEYYYDATVNGKCLIKRSQTTTGHTDNTISNFTFNGNTTFDVYGNIMSLYIIGTGFTTATTINTADTYTFKGLLQNSNVVDASNLILPVTTLAYGCYEEMFNGCTSLTTAPSILPAITLAYDCYKNMFYGCTSLTTAPELPATTLVSNCYQSMFQGCTSLTTAPELPATTLASWCYVDMFNGCSNLNYIKCLVDTAPDCSSTTQECYGWVYGVAQNGTFVKSANAKIDDSEDVLHSWYTGVSGIPVGWTVVNA